MISASRPSISITMSIVVRSTNFNCRAGIQNRAHKPLCGDQFGVGIVTGSISMTISAAISITGSIITPISVVVPMRICNGTDKEQAYC